MVLFSFGLFPVAAGILGLDLLNELVEQGWGVLPVGAEQQRRLEESFDIGVADWSIHDPRLEHTIGQKIRHASDLGKASV